MKNKQEGLKLIVTKEDLTIQKTFRTILQSMSHPGRVYTLTDELKNGLILIIQTLIDHEVTFSVYGPLKEEWEYRIIRSTGSRRANIEHADFLIILSGSSDGSILHAKRGSLEYPDTGATVIYSVNSLFQTSYMPNVVNGGTNNDVMVELKGPGINGRITTFIGGINKDELHYLKEINSEYPLGVDSIFIDAKNRIMCIPRSTKIEVI